MARDQLVVGGSLQSCRQQGSIPWRASTVFRCVQIGPQPSTPVEASAARSNETGPAQEQGHADEIARACPALTLTLEQALGDGGA